MNFHVLVLPEAKEDLIDIYEYVSAHDSNLSADRLLDILEEKVRSLDTHPERGHAVPELAFVHVSGFCEIHFKPYRIIYQIAGSKVYVHAVLDGRRGLQEVLEGRLLR